MMNVLSLFANIGIAETYLKDIGFEVVVANEIDEKRQDIYKYFYPECEAICGDIKNDSVRNKIVELSKKKNVELVIATPPCQGMSTAGKMEELDPRNQLIYYAIDIVKRINPKYVFFENVPMQLLTKVLIDDKEYLIPDFVYNELGNLYEIRQEVVNVADYGVPQMRERAIFLLTRKDQKVQWDFPEKDTKRKTLYDAIGHIPIIDPLIYDISYDEHLKIFPNYEKRKEEALKISKWNIPPKHVLRQVIAMQHTPTGETAFNNERYKPVNKEGKLVKGYANTYKRQSWDMPAYTITMYNRTISSQNNVHPGRRMSDGLYSDPRVLTTYELMLCMSLPANWEPPNWVSESFLRSLIGEGIPPLFVKKVFKKISKEG